MAKKKPVKAVGVPAAAEPAATAAVNPDYVPPKRGKICPHCGKLTPSRSSVCAACGKPTPSKAEMNGGKATKKKTKAAKATGHENNGLAPSGSNHVDAAIAFVRLFGGVDKAIGILQALKTEFR